MRKLSGRLRVFGDDRVGMIGAEPADVIDGRIHVGNDLHCHDHIEELMAPVVCVGGDHCRVDGACCLVSADLDARLMVAGDEIGQELCCDLFMDEHGLGGVAGGRRRCLARDRDLQGLLEIRFGVDVHVADPVEVLHGRNGGILAHVPDERFATARDDQVDTVVEREQLGDGLTPGGPHEHERLLG